MSAKTLLPRPFCGSVAHLLTGMVEFVDVEVTCTVCAATGGNENNGATEAENRATAIAAWNRRTPPAPMEAVAAVDNAARGGIVWANSAVTLETGTPLYTHPPQPDAPGWRDIATAPRDGTVFLARCGDWAPFECQWHGEQFVHMDPEEGPIGYKPDQWQPLNVCWNCNGFGFLDTVPPPPSADAKQADALPGDLRERVARILDPLLFELIEALNNASGEPPDLRKAASAMRDARMETAFNKADAILSLIQSERGAS